MLNGRDIIHLVQLEDAAIGSDALVVAEQTEGSYSIENELVDEQSKMGRILAYGSNSESFELTAYGVRNDSGQMAVLEGIKKKKRLKVWEVDIVPNAEGTYNATFAYCLVESVEKSSPGDNFVEISATLQVEGESVEGVLTTLPEGVSNAKKIEFEEPGETGAAAPPPTTP
ncbi:TP901-1 family phage major tail protein [Cytobacillus horneckiae]|uniref:phage major tail protein, TP901-1 family n=1 Tax=Cytobacillus horneckiae TaxID=549687 RepID=UPI0019D04AE2|nr:phage major tail protein, TP901-1 family [Cytobacillus horneckiae]MBN6886245.1 phage major tail protein, TP901-1 family [Cytobacillus horneckiae]